VFDGNTYIAEKSFQSSAVETSLGGARSNLEITAILDPDALARADLERGLLNDAEVSLVIIDYQHPEYGSLRVFEGRAQELIAPDNLNTVITITGNLARLGKSLTEEYSPTCRADFGDSRCGVNIADFSQDFTVTGTVTGGQGFETGNTITANLYKLGIVLWTVGNNTGIAQEVATNEADGTVFLFFLPPFPIQVGDEGTLFRGCAKTVAACKSYGNILNYRGEPYLPGDDFINQPPKQLTTTSQSIKVQ